MLSLNPLNKVQKVHSQKVLHTVMKVKNSIFQFFCHFFVDNFLRMSFCIFSTDTKSASNSASSDTHCAFLKIFFL
jgi:hypothetical protein